MTEMQAAVGKVQLGKLNYIINENKKRYVSFERNLSSSVSRRKIPEGSEPIYDTFILFIEDKSKRENVVNILHKEGFGTKNLPDAIEWHCSSFWNHALSSKEIDHSNSTKLLLETAVAVPILSLIHI